MRRIADKLIYLLITSATAVFRGFVIGLIISMAIYTIRHYPLWTLGFTCFFSAFNLSDLKRFHAERNWFALCGRVIFLYAITGGIVSFVVLAINGPAGADEYDLYIAFSVVAAAVPAALGWTLLVTYGAETSLYREVVGVIDGLKARGVLGE